MTQIRRQIDGVRDRARGTEFFQSPLLFGGIDLTEVVNADFTVGDTSRFEKIGNGDLRQKPDYSRHDHDFSQREASPAGRVDFHTVCSRREPDNRRIIVLFQCVHVLPITDRSV